MGWLGSRQTAPAPLHLRSLPPCFFLGQGQRQVKWRCQYWMFLTDTPHPFQLFSSTYYPYSEHPKHKIELGSYGVKGPGILAGQAGCSGPFQAPRMAPSTLHTAGKCGLGTGRGPRPWPGVGFLPPGTVVPCSGQQTKSYETAKNPCNVFSLMRLSD